MRVADYIADYIYTKLGIDTIFLVPGGGSMFLTDGIRCHPNLKHVCCHHEQATAMAASGYARASGKPGACCVTTGCGSTNAITGVLGAFQDRIPMIIISGQTKLKETIAHSGAKLPIRQMGVQETDIISIVRPITKYAVTIEDPNEIKQILNLACWFMKTPPSGPVWINVPLDVQGAQIEVDKLITYPMPKEPSPDYNNVSLLLNLLESSKRPIIVAGHGIRLDNALLAFKDFVTFYNIPVVFSRLGIDVLPYNNPLHIGRIGTKGDRAGNFAVQNADLVISMGSRLSVSSIGQEYDLFAREAKKVVIDVDPNEHEKKTIKIDLFLRGRISKFLEVLNTLYMPGVNFSEWAEKCLYWKKKWPMFQPEYLNSEKVNLYYFIDKLSEKLKENAIIIGDAGSALFVPGQAFKNKEGQILMLSGGQSEMGFTIPACVGASVAKGEVIGITGDGSFQMNIQELQTIVHHNLPIKLFVWNNEGYLSMRNTQKKFFGNFIACGPESGDLSFPSLEKIAYAYGIKYFKCNTKSLDQVMDDVLAFQGPVICEVLCVKNQDILTVSSVEKDGKMVSMPLEDMYPFLPREEFLREMIVTPLESSK